MNTSTHTAPAGDLQAITQNVPPSYCAVAASGHGFGIFKVTAHKGKIIEKGPVIRHCKVRS